MCLEIMAAGKGATSAEVPGLPGPPSDHERSRKISEAFEHNQAKEALADCGLELPRHMNLLSIEADDAMESGLWDDVVLHKDSEASASSIRDMISAQVVQLMTIAGLFGAVTFVSLVTPATAVVTSMQQNVVVGRALSLSAGIIAMLMHFSAVMAALSFDGLVRSAVAKEHLVWLFRAHASQYSTIVLSLQAGMVANLCQVALVFDAIYSRLDAVISLVVFGAWISWAFRTHVEAQKVRVIMIAATVTGRTARVP